MFKRVSTTIVLFREQLVLAAYPDQCLDSEYMNEDSSGCVQIQLLETEVESDHSKEDETPGRRL